MTRKRLQLLGTLMAATVALTACAGTDDTDAGDDAAAQGDAAEDAGSDDAADEGDDAGGDDAADGGGTELAEVCDGQDGQGRTVGFANIGESIPFAVLVREGIEEVAADCNVEIVNADNELDPQKALANARNFATQGVDGAILFQVDQSIAPAICDILGDIPVIAIDIQHEPCAVFMGANNRVAGEMTGAGAGALADEMWDCEVDAIVTFEGFASGQVNIDRLNGSIAGLQSVCRDLEYGDFEDWDPNEEGSIITRLDADRTDPAFQKGTDWLTANPDADNIVALCLNEDSCIGFHSAVENAGRSGEVIFASNGADPTGHDAIAEDPMYAGATGFFPERYGELLIPNIIRMMDGEEPASDPLLMEHVFITGQNINEFYPDA